MRDARAVEPTDLPTLSKVCPAWGRVRAETGFLLPSLLVNRDAQRVNAILSLYDKASDNPSLNGLADNLSSSNDLMKHLVKRAQELRALKKAPEGVEFGAIWSSRQLAETLKAYPSTRSAAIAFQQADNAAKAVWREALTVLASEARRNAVRLAERTISSNEQTNDDVSDALWAVAEIAADLTSPEGLRLFLCPVSATTNREDCSNPPEHIVLAPPVALVGGRLKNLRERIPALGETNQIDVAAFKPIQGLLTRVLLGHQIDERDCLDAGLSSTQGTCGSPAAFRSRGVALARELLVADSYLESLNDRNPLGLVVSPAPLSLGSCLKTTGKGKFRLARAMAPPPVRCPDDPDIPKLLAAIIDEIEVASADRKQLLEYLQQQLSQHGSTGLGAGRPEEGIETLIERYLKKRQAEYTSSSHEVKQAQSTLLDGLVQFSEKVLIIANNEILLREQPGPTFESFSATVFDDTADKYVRVLQAVGNSILTQVDELRHRESFGFRDRWSTGIEVKGLRGAEENAARPALPDVLKQIDKANDLAGIDAVRAAIKDKRDDVVVVRDALKTAEGDQQSAADQAKAKQGKFERAQTVLKSQEFAQVLNRLPTIAATQPSLASLVTQIRAWLDDGKFTTMGQDYEQTLAAFTILTGLDATVPMKPVPALQRLRSKLRDEKKRADTQGDTGKDDAAKLATAIRVIDSAAVTAAVNGLPSEAAATPTMGTLVQALKTWLEDGKTPTNRGDYAATMDAVGTFEPFDATTAKKPSSAHADLLAVLADQTSKDDKTATSATKTATKYKGWREKLDAQIAGAIPPLNLPVHGREGPHEKFTSRDVADTLIARLRYGHVLAVQDGRSEEARQFESAIEPMAAYRSAMVYIRPAAAYLRNSYPASSVQRDPTFGVWRNMLSDQALRQVPFYEYSLANPSAKNSAITTAIDKQFWQNVNQVRLAGSGNTNYAIAKDDVGNWYVKGYSTDVNDIITSAKNLALFAAGPSLGTTLGPLPPVGGARKGLQGAPGEATALGSGQAGEIGPSGQPTSAPTTVGTRTTLGRQIDRFGEKYQKRRWRRSSQCESRHKG